MKIISYNINGIRAALKKNLINWIESESPDIICFQEIKANKDQFDFEIFNSLGYYNFWFSAQKKGYSGVAILSKIEPKKQIIILGHMDQCIDLEIKIPIIGTIKTYRLV